MNRQEYLKASTDCGKPDSSLANAAREAVHHNYYLQFRSPELERLLLGGFDLDELAQAYASDRHLNNLALRRWDNFSSSFQRFVDRDKITALGEGMSLSTCVCTMKNIAIALVKESTPN